MKWSDLLLLLQFYEKEGETGILDQRVSFTSTDALEYLDLVESASKGTLTLIADWNYVPEDDDG